MDNKIPTYYITVNPEFAEEDEFLGITQIAYTSTPAIEVMGLAFDKVKELRFVDDVKGIVAAPALVPDMPIKRYDDEIGDYFVVFSTEDILMMSEQFNRNIKENQFNYNHDSTKVAPSFMLYNWIIEDPSTDLSLTKYGIEGLKMGTWFTVSKFDSIEEFNKEILEGGKNGLSVEGIFALALKQIKEKYNTIKKNENEMNKNQKFETLPDGEYMLPDGNKLIVKDGVAVIEPVEQEMEVVSEEEVTVEEMVEKEKEEEMVEHVEEVVEAPVAEAAPAEDLKSYVDGKINDLLAVIAELKSMIEGADVEEEAIVSGVEDSMKAKAQALNIYFSQKRKK